MNIDPDDKTETVRMEVPKWLKRRFQAAAAEDGNDMTEELADLVRFRDKNESKFRRADFSRPRRRDRG